MRTEVPSRDRRAALAASLLRRQGSVERVGASRQQVRVSSFDWRLEALWGERSQLHEPRPLMKARDHGGVQQVQLVSVRCSGWGLVVLDSTGEVSCFDLRRLGVCVNMLAGESLPPPAAAPAAPAPAAEAGAPPSQNHNVKNGRFSSEFDWRAGKQLAASQTFCDVLCRGGAVGHLVCDRVKAVTCRAHDGRVHALDVKSGQVLSSGLPHASSLAPSPADAPVDAALVGGLWHSAEEAGGGGGAGLNASAGGGAGGAGGLRRSFNRWHSRATTGVSSSFLWDPALPETLLVGSQHGVLGVLQLPLF